MANPSWFNETTYLNSKLAQLQETGSIQFVNVGQVKAAIEAAGMTTYDHFVKYSASELTTPNAYFDAEQYLAAKAKQLGGSATAASVQTAIMNAGMTLYDHFMKYGWAENVNPSNAFDVSDYIAANATKAGLTSEQVIAAYTAAGLDPISHFYKYGQAEGLTIPAVPAGETVLEDDTSGNDYGVSLQLTRNIDSTDPAIRPGANILQVTDKDDKYTGTVHPAGNTENTLNSDDWIDGQGGNDRLTLDLVTNYAGNARIKNIEELVVGTNTARTDGINAPNGGINFDYNVNFGSQQITEVLEITYDQINSNEILGVSHIVKSGDVVPTLKWDNEANSTAGRIQADFRQSLIDNTVKTTTLTVKLDDVLANINDATTGMLDIGFGIETLNLVSDGTSKLNTLNASAHNDGGAVDIVSEGSGTLGQANFVVGDGANDNGSLTKVVMSGSQALGKAAQVVASTSDASYGLTDRAFANDLGISNDTGTLRATSSNLLSVAATVTEVDASAADGGVNVRFTAKQNAADTDVIFKGSKVADYVEFQQGVVDALGGAGDDIFAFLNNNLANATFGESDKIVGEAGIDTIQIGLNGAAVAGNYNISETELRNKSGIDVIDVRGKTTFLTLSSDFVAAADDKTITVRTDKIVQTSDTDSANSTTTTKNNPLEDNATTTLNLTKLANTQGITFLGGSGSDRIILNDATFNVLQILDGGVYEDAPFRAAGSTRHDTITVVTNGENVVIDDRDLSNVENFEGFVLTKNSLMANYTITLTKAFINANTQASDNANTAINDTIFQIGTSNAANNSQLGAGDIVTIDIRNLLNSTDTARATGYAGRSFDVTSLANVGATVQFVGNTGDLTLAQVRAIAGGPLVANNADVNFADVTTTSAAGAALGGGGGVVPPTPGTITVPTGSTAPITATAAADKFSFDALAAIKLTATTQININDFNVTADTLSIDSTTASGAITLAQLNGVDGIVVQANQITGDTLINFGQNNNGDIVSITLVGVSDPALVNVTVI